MAEDGPRPAAEVSWSDREPRFSDVGRELRRVLRRGVRRPLVVSAIVAMAMLAGPLRSLRQPLLYTSTIVFRVTEGDLDEWTAPPPVREIRSYIFDVVFTTENILKVARKHHLHERLAELDPALAAAEFRDEIGVVVEKNYFLEYRDPNDPPRSALISINYSNTDPDLAFAVVQDLQKLVEEDQGVRQAAEVARADLDATEALDRLRDEVDQRRRAVVELRLAMEGRPAQPEEYVELASRQSALAALQEQLARRLETKSQLDLRAGLERTGLGTTLALVDPGQPAPRKSRLGTSLSTIAMTFVPLVFMVILGVGVFDPYLRLREDAERLGYTILAELPPSLVAGPRRPSRTAPMPVVERRR